MENQSSFISINYPLSSIIGRGFGTLLNSDNSNNYPCQSIYNNLEHVNSQNSHNLHFSNCHPYQLPPNCVSAPEENFFQPWNSNLINLDYTNVFASSSNELENSVYRNCIANGISELVQSNKVHLQIIVLCMLLQTIIVTCPITGYQNFDQIWKPNSHTLVPTELSSLEQPFLTENIAQPCTSNSLGLEDKNRVNISSTNERKHQSYENMICK